ncbi:MAG TPA: rod shape-determining protein RodA [Chloroflexia bacterium]|nr:rod shape-determining protein RodA [Chloroflexia bacterium]
MLRAGGNSSNFDFALVLCTLVASAVGIIMVFSATKATHGGSITLGDFTSRQAIYAFAGLVLMLVLARINYRFLESFTLPFYFATLGLLGLVMVLGHVGGGSQRWLNLGFFPIQPSEIAKLALIITLAKIFSDHEREMHRARWFILAAVVTGIPAAIVLEQPDLGTALMLVAIFLGMTLGAGVKARIFIVAGLITVPAVVAFWTWLMHDYQRKRLLIFLDPMSDLMGEGYNIIQSRITIGSGGWLGQGYMAGSQSQGGFLKVQYSDFIYSVVAEEFGFIGAMALVALLFIIVWRCLVIATRAKDAYGSLIAVGVATWIGMQVFINVGMNIGLMPVTGIPLPFISYGGSSLMSILLGLGLVHSVGLRSSPVIFGGNTWSPGWARSGRTTLRPR